MNQKLLIPKNFRFMGKTQAELYKEAISKKEEKTPPKQPITVTPNSIREVIPLTDDTTTKFTALQALEVAKAKSKSLASLKDVDAYVLKHGGHYWTGDFIAYCKPEETLGKEINYTDGNGISYNLKIPKQFQHLTGETALILPYGNNSQSPNYEFTPDFATGIWTVKINTPNLIIPTQIKRKNGYYKANAGKFPNGDELPKDGTADNTYRYLWQINNGAYIGLLARGFGVGFGNGNYVDAFSRPGRFGVLVYKD